MLQASLHPYGSWQEYWAFESRFITLNYLDQPVGQSYLALKSLVEGKHYHIITTNADNAFDAAEYDMMHVFHIQGSIYCNSVVSIVMLKHIVMMI